MADSEALPIAAPTRAPPLPPAANAAGAAALHGRSYAVIEAAAAAEAPPQVPSPARTAAAALRGHLAWVADVLLLAYCAASWANLTANGVAIVARWAHGDDSPAAAAAKKAASAALIVMGVLSTVAFPRFMSITEKWREVGDRQVGSGATRRGCDVQRDRPASSGPGARPCQNAGPACATVVALLVLLVCMPGLLVGLLNQVHAPAKGSYQEKFGSPISDMACLIATLVLCSFLLPGTVIQLLRHGYGVRYGRWQLNA